MQEKKDTSSDTEKMKIGVMLTLLGFIVVGLLWNKPESARKCR
jgi:hypothetical protein